MSQLAVAKRISSAAESAKHSTLSHDADGGRCVQLVLSLVIQVGIDRVIVRSICGVGVPTVILY